ncbi:MAG TPA: hypothetical protein VNV63_06745 [Nitrospiria bacterium]|jgi:hypothetical protein|nr:hypothetical protein [Nitrospiria bacterium]
MKIEPGSDLERIVFHYGIFSDHLPEEMIAPLREGQPPYRNEAELFLDEKKYQACLYACYRQSLGEMQRLGYTEQTESIIWPMGRAAALMEIVKPEPDLNPRISSFPYFAWGDLDKRVVAAAQKYGLLVDEPYRMPDLMWHLLAHRRDGDAVIFLAGDDRSYEHFFGIVWSPERLQRGDIPHAIV